MSKPEGNSIQVSANGNKDWKFYIYLTKIFLKEKETVELNGLGTAIPICVKIAENLQRNNYAVIDKIETQSIDSQRDDRTTKKIKISVKLSKGSDFDKLTASLKTGKPEN